MLGTIDIIAGVLLLFYSPASIVHAAVGFLILAKGLYSVFAGLVAGYCWDILGWLDIIAGVSLSIGLSIPFLWVLVMLKGILSWF